MPHIELTVKAKTIKQKNTGECVCDHEVGEALWIKEKTYKFNVIKIKTCAF